MSAAAVSARNTSSASLRTREPPGACATRLIYLLCLRHVPSRRSNVVTSLAAVPQVKPASSGGRHRVRSNAEQACRQLCSDLS